MVNEPLITDRDLCAARAFLRWTQDDLAREAGVPVVYIRRFERGGAMREDSLRQVIATLTKAGVVFIKDTTVDEKKIAEGVALKKSAKPKPQFVKRVYPPRKSQAAGIEAGPGSAAAGEAQTRLHPPRSKAVAKRNRSKAPG